MTDETTSSIAHRSARPAAGLACSPNTELRCADSEPFMPCHRPVLLPPRAAKMSSPRGRRPRPFSISTARAALGGRGHISTFPRNRGRGSSKNTRPLPSVLRKACERRSKRAQNCLTRWDVVSHPKSSAGQRGLPSALRNGCCVALAEEFGGVTRCFPWSVIAIEALSPMVFIHTRWIIMVPGHQHLLGFLAPLFESHRRLMLYSAARDRSSANLILFRKQQVATF